MHFSFGSPVALFASLSLIFFRHASAQIPVNVNDLDPLKDCKRRELKCEETAGRHRDDVALTHPVFENDNKVYMYGGQVWVKNGTKVCILAS